MMAMMVIAMVMLAKTMLITLYFYQVSRNLVALSSTMMIMAILMVMMGKNMVLTQNNTSIFSRSAATGRPSPPR